MSRRRATLLEFAKGALLAAAYLLLARFGLRMHAVSSFASLVWPPTGVALVSMLLWGFRFFPAITLGAFLANLWTGAPPLVALGIAAGNTLEAVAGAYALRRIPGFRSTLDRLIDVVGLILLAGVGGLDDQRDDRSREPRRGRARAAGRLLDHVAGVVAGRRDRGDDRSSAAAHALSDPARGGSLRPASRKARRSASC